MGFIAPALVPATQLDVVLPAWSMRPLATVLHLSGAALHLVLTARGQPLLVLTVAEAANLAVAHCGTCVQPTRAAFVAARLGHLLPDRFARQTTGSNDGAAELLKDTLMNFKFSTSREVACCTCARSISGSGKWHHSGLSG